MSCIFKKALLNSLLNGQLSDIVHAIKWFKKFCFAKKQGRKSDIQCPIQKHFITKLLFLHKVQYSNTTQLKSISKVELSFVMNSFS